MRGNPTRLDLRPHTFFHPLNTIAHPHKNNKIGSQCLQECPQVIEHAWVVRQVTVGTSLNIVALKYGCKINRDF